MLPFEVELSVSGSGVMNRTCYWFPEPASRACSRGRWPLKITTPWQLGCVLRAIIRRRANRVTGKGSVESFRNISNEVLSLRAVLEESRETLLEPQLPPEREARLKVVLGGCKVVLEDLQTLVTKYERLGSKSKLTFDRVKSCNENITDIRDRLISNVGLLTALIR